MASNVKLIADRNAVLTPALRWIGLHQPGAR
ncbi:hypothetical protein Pvag_pPag10004 (plasmid) [Pantoea vagans C9-1]|nr:hypothetical protein Pvag_pPag10004 [Pantoea vagans C9-1]